jgi:hypothetical protein
VFLDIDGVVVTEESLRTGGAKSADRSCVSRLSRIVDTAGADIVISSSWRLVHSLDFIRQMLAEAGFRLPERVIGATDSLRYRLENGTATGRAERADEILAWLDRNGRRVFVVLDDDLEAEIAGHYVRTDPRSGLGDDHATEALAILLGSSTEGPAESR